MLYAASWSFTHTKSLEGALDSLHLARRRKKWMGGGWFGGQGGFEEILKGKTISWTSAGHHKNGKETIKSIQHGRAFKNEVLNKCARSP